MDLWKTSGHLEFYRESMFDQMDVEEEEYQVLHGTVWYYTRYCTQHRAFRGAETCQRANVGQGCVRRGPAKR